VHVTGRVTRGGESAAGVSVRARSLSGESRKNRYAETNAAGEYELTLDEAGRYNFALRAGDDEIDFQREIAEGDSAREDFELPMLSLSGTVTGPDGDVQSGMRVTLQRVPADGDEEGVSYREYSRSTDDDGRYDFGGLQAGTYMVRAQPQSSWRRRAKLAPAGRSDLVLAAGNSLTGVDLQLETPGTIRGVLYASDGSPAAGVWVQATDEGGIHMYGGGSNSTDRNGRFRISGLPPGKIFLVANVSPNMVAEAEVEVFAEQESEVDLHLEDR